MKRTYTLKRDLEINPRTMELAQKLTHDRSRPKMGLKGRHGLFGSSEWWAHVADGTIRTVSIEGVIADVYAAGQDTADTPDTIDIKLGNGDTVPIGIYMNDPADTGLFVVGREVRVVYALDDLKDQPGPDGSINQAEIALEMAVAI